MQIHPALRARIGQFTVNQYIEQRKMILSDALVPSMLDKAFKGELRCVWFEKMARSR